MSTPRNLITIAQRQRRFASWVADVLVYIVVLNLFVEFSDAVVIESFWISILMAVLLWTSSSVTRWSWDRVRKN